jgi:hypothetical protein
LLLIYCEPYWLLAFLIGGCCWREAPASPGLALSLVIRDLTHLFTSLFSQTCSQKIVHVGIRKMKAVTFDEVVLVTEVRSFEQEAVDDDET